MYDFWILIKSKITHYIVRDNKQIYLSHFKYNKMIPRKIKGQIGSKLFQWFKWNGMSNSIITILMNKLNHLGNIECGYNNTNVTLSNLAYCHSNICYYTIDLLEGANVLSLVLVSFSFSFSFSLCFSLSFFFFLCFDSGDLVRSGDGE